MKDSLAKKTYEAGFTTKLLLKLGTILTVFGPDSEGLDQHTKKEQNLARNVFAETFVQMP